MLIRLERRTKQSITGGILGVLIIIIEIVHKRWRQRGQRRN